MSPITKLVSEKASTRLNIVPPEDRLSKESHTLLDRVSRIRKNPIGLRNEKGEKGSPLSPEDFNLVKSNFPYFFYKDDGEEFNIGRTYRKKEPFKECLANQPDELQTLVDELGTYRLRQCYIDKEINQTVDLPQDPRRPEMEKKLYKAYLLMREYVDDDRKLFT
jgi:hypothetical protein